MRVEIDDLHRRLAAYGEAPCTDGSCILIHPGGMRTNGGCQHLKLGSSETRSLLRRVAAVMRSYAEVKP